MSKLFDMIVDVDSALLESKLRDKNYRPLKQWFGDALFMATRLKLLLNFVFEKMGKEILEELILNIDGFYGKYRHNFEKTFCKNLTKYSDKSLLHASLLDVGKCKKRSSNFHEIMSILSERDFEEFKCQLVDRGPEYEIMRTAVAYGTSTEIFMLLQCVLLIKKERGLIDIVLNAKYPFFIDEDLKPCEMEIGVIKVFEFLKKQVLPKCEMIEYFYDKIIQEEISEEVCLWLRVCEFKIHFNSSCFIVTANQILNIVYLALGMKHVEDLVKKAITFSDNDLNSKEAKLIFEKLNEINLGCEVDEKIKSLVKLLFDFFLANSGKLKRCNKKKCCSWD